MRRNVQATEREFEPILCSRDHPDAVILHHPPPSSTILHQAPPTSPNLPNLPQPPSGSRLDVGERRHVEKPQPREPRVLVHLDEQQVGDTHDGGGALASYADVEHRLI